MDHDKDDSATCKCEHCRREIPLSSAITSEGTDYTRYFCGLDCLKKWKEKKKSTDNKG